jgi:uncharacterized membrane protein
MGRLKLVMRCLLGVFFVLTGVNHFLNPEFYVRIMPPYLPWHLPLVYVSGAFEAILGVLVLVPKTANLAAWGLIVLLVAVFPANVHMAMNPQLYPEFSPAALWGRLPLQLVFIAWAYWFTESGPAGRRKDEPGPEGTESKLTEQELADRHCLREGDFE